MTANDTNSAASDNSVFQGTEDESDTPANDNALAQIIDYAAETGGTATRRGLEIKTRRSTDQLKQSLDRLESLGYVELIGDTDRQMVLLTSRGERFAGRDQ